jgi:signal transduction histidine kinase
MKIRNRILIFFSVTVISLAVASFSLVYFLFSNYREEEFQQRQKEKIKYTIELIADYKELSENLSAIMDKLTIHDFYDEKMLIFDGNKNLIYKSIDDLPIHGYEELLSSLSSASPWIETKEGKYDVIALYIENDFNRFYAISKAYDEFGYSKLRFLRNVLIAVTAFIAVFVLLISFRFAKMISEPISRFSMKVAKCDFSGEIIETFEHEETFKELKDLSQKFNELVKRTNDAFSFQKHIVQHISHELKTPIAVLVSELEKLKRTDNVKEIQAEIETQIGRAKSLGETVNALLQISKIETGNRDLNEKIRIDELTFDVIGEISALNSAFSFETAYFPEDFDENKLYVLGDKMLLKQALLNILSNAVSYSDNQKAKAEFCGDNENYVVIRVVNSGNPLTKEEEKLLFRYFFRGENSRGVAGFGLGLVLAKKIADLHGGALHYYVKENTLNCFEIRLPLLRSLA